MNPAPHLATAPPAGVATMLRRLLDRWRRLRPATRATLLEAAGEPPEDHAGTAYWQDPAFWLWMVR
jgi:hypothetical protein